MRFLSSGRINVLYNIVELLCDGKAAEAVAGFCLLKKGEDENTSFIAMLGEGMRFSRCLHTLMQRLVDVETNLGSIDRPHQPSLSKMFHKKFLIALNNS